MAAAESTPLAQNSPFTPAGGPGGVTVSPDELYEFAGVSTIGKDTTVNIFQKSIKKGRWIPVGAKVDGITVARYDAARDQVVIRIDGGAEKVLALRKPSASAGKPGAIMPTPALPVGFTMTPTQNAPLPAPAPAAVPLVAPDPTTSNAAATATAPATAAPPPPPPAPGTVAHQEQEARMLVSDLLEIGMAQRKAYEEAQAKAAQTNAPAQPATPSPPAPAPAPAGPAQP